MIAVVYRKSKLAKRAYLTVFENEKTPDRIINANARKPLIPNEYFIEAIGIGESFIETFKSKYGIRKHEVA